MKRSRLKFKDKRGDFTGLLYLVVSIAALAIVILIGGYIATEVSGKLKTKIGSDTSEVNDSFDTTTNIAENTLSAIWYVVFSGLIIGLMITGWFVPTHPVMAIPFAILLIVGIILGVGFSNAYEELTAVPQFSNISSTQGSVDFMMSNLPYVILIIGVLIMVITFAKPGGRSYTQPIA